MLRRHPPLPLYRPQLAATLVHPASGRGLDILTTAPALVLFTGGGGAVPHSLPLGRHSRQWVALHSAT